MSIKCQSRYNIAEVLSLHYNRGVVLVFKNCAEERIQVPNLQMGSMQLQMGASAATEAMMADRRGCASRMVCSACRAADRCSLRL